MDNSSASANFKEGISFMSNISELNSPLKVPNSKQPKKACFLPVDKTSIVEELLWLKCNDCIECNFTPCISTSDAKIDMNTEDSYCDLSMLQTLIETKQNVFDESSVKDLKRARGKANPFERINAAFFMNRAALKMANIDAATGFMFTNIDRDPNHRNPNNVPFYFADVCAGPGGFTEYILWRKKWAFKGFGFTLKGVHDFTVQRSECCLSGVNFQPFYGSVSDGDVFKPKNIQDFKEKVMDETDGKGVHFMMSDGGFCVDGNENLQEVLAKQIYACQCLVALEIVRTNGHFVTKLFDTFTAFSVGLLYLMHLCFNEIAILKPNTSRPANAERYLICKGRRNTQVAENVTKHLRAVVKYMFENSPPLQLREIVSQADIEKCKKFVDYVTDRNNKLGRLQTKGLEKLAEFCLKPKLEDTRQEELRVECLASWRVPDKKRHECSFTIYEVDDLLKRTLSKTEILHVQPSILTTMQDVRNALKDIDDWNYCPMYSSSYADRYNFYAGLTHNVPNKMQVVKNKVVDKSDVFRLQNRIWIKVKRLHLVPGTLLCGEMVPQEKENLENVRDHENKTLHVIDALRLGDTSLADLPYNERLALIQLYCKSITFKTIHDRMKVIPKVSDQLRNIVDNPLVKSDGQNSKQYYCNFPSGDRGHRPEKFAVNSILFLKTDKTQLFNTTCVLRCQMFLDNQSSDDDCVSLGKLIQYVKDCL